MTGDFALTDDELRAVVRFVEAAAADVLPVFETARPDDPRPRAALDAARQFIEGARRTKLQRATALDAHRAAREAPTEASRLAAQAAGDAAAAAYLHPIAKEHQVGHILRAAANAARIAELEGADADAGLARVRARATPVLIDVLCRYPRPRTGTSRIVQLLSTLDASLRTLGP
ncbi:hypothetical protein SAMN04489835_2821 [Mycolicibacterium rutilum]|uniref:Imm-5-like domain-containing protein n=1 Tax=Mycolicibacterium rutilum TaxID=370526 RepID=A0A1H6K8K3_MYCRU|nr:exonuclease SbcC [Mycolicibacterium rutilum]SEH68152.1 hypothetical protein SAMN04489835_2821 [Mycolicibacterium rutilum]